MQTKAALMVLVLLSGTIAGCTGDPDGGGNDGIDSDSLDELFDQYFEDFLNNTTITVNNHYYNNTTYIVDDGDYSTTVVNEYNNTTINEGDQTSTNNYNNQTDYDYSELNYSFGGVAGGNGSGGMLYLLDIQFTLDDLMPADWAEVDHRNNTIDYEYTYYDYLTNSDRTDVFTIQCSDYYLIGSQSPNGTAYTYWENQDNYFSAWENEYNQTIANMLQSAAYAYIWIENADNDYYVRAACDENYVYGNGHIDDLLLFEIDIPAGVALAGVYDSYFRGIEEYVWDYEEWDEYYYPELDSPHSSWSAFSVSFEFETISWSYQYGGWVGGDEQSVLSVNVNNIYPGYEYRLIAYFVMSPVLPLE